MELEFGTEFDGEVDEECIEEFAADDSSDELLAAMTACAPPTVIREFLIEAIASSEVGDGFQAGSGSVEFADNLQR
ncbi:MAG: hypothetical protein AAF531_23665, partial [Actinomycetota bacterium]